MNERSSNVWTNRVRNEYSVERDRDTISALELKQLLVQLVQPVTVCFRFRLVGEMWMMHHMRVCSVNDRTVLLLEEASGRYHLTRINSIMQFDIDEKFQTYLPNHHYTVTPSRELD